MIRVPGTLVVKQIKGANGKFCVGDLTTPIGEFKVKEQILDQFEEGRYVGEFMIQQLYPNSFTWRGRVTTEIRAKVVEVFLDEVDEGCVEDAQPEPDPITEQTPPVQPAGSSIADAVATAPVQVPALPTNENLVTNDGDAPAEEKNAGVASLFGAELASLISTFQAVKLDPTVDRNRFREQRDFLKKLGYSFNAMEQIWHHA